MKPHALRVLTTRTAGLTAAFAIVMLSHPPGVQAYIGPGAGIAFVSSFLILLVTFLLAFVTLLTWPFRWLLQTLRGRRALRQSRVRRVVIMGLDGQDPDLTEKFMSQGQLPNFSRLREQGTYTRLETTFPAESPVAWSSFQTGCNPGRHRVFDFLVPNRKNYLPELCSARIEPPDRSFTLGRHRIPLGKARIFFERKSRSFWKILGDHGIFSTILRVPVSFPPERFHGVLLSAMSVPDLLGTQGTFCYYSSDPEEKGRFTGGIHIPIQLENGSVRAFISGPQNPYLKDGGEMRIPFSVERNGTEGAVLNLQGRRHPLPLCRHTPWIPLQFRAAAGRKIRGMVRFYLKEASPHMRLYQTPIHLSPEKPALPISHPVAYSIYLAKTLGSYATLGLAEDTWALNEGVLDEAAFLEQSYLVHGEREAMFFDALEKTRRGAVVCVFDITDRLQHMFWRYLEEDHPANAGKDTEQYQDEILKLYRRMDGLVGKVLAQMKDDDLLIVLSDHGFKPFKRGVNLNSWLHRNGYLSVKENASAEGWFHGVDWSRTRAYAVGLGGIYLNLSGREAQGTIQPGQEAQRLKAEIIARLQDLRDPQNGAVAVSHVYDTSDIYKGPYSAEGPDLIIGFSPGYRVSWSSAIGAVSEEIFEDNVKRWSGDHCVNPPQVPGILFLNRKISLQRASILDVAPTVLDLFGVPVPPYCDGKSWMPA